MVKVKINKEEGLISWTYRDFCGSTYQTTLIDNTLLLYQAVAQQVESEDIAKMIIQNMINSFNHAE